MQQDDSSRLEEGFARAAELPVEERARFLHEFCAEDQALLREIEDLLAHDHPEFMEHPALNSIDLEAGLFDSPISEGAHIGPYKIVGELGRGGMAVVYLGERVDGQFDQRVAIKVFDRLYSASADKVRFNQELRILSQMDNPYVASIYDAGTMEGLAYFVMPYIEGLHIDAYCREANLSIPDCIRLFLNVCEGVSAAHNNQIVHRDIKPANILVDKTGTPKLIDFGIAKKLDTGAADSLTAPGLAMLTILYASPERLSGDSDLADLPSSDVYSLGVVLYEMLTGRRPIEPPANLPQSDVPRFLIETEAAQPSRYRREISRDLDTVVLKALRKDRKERYSSVEQFARYLALYLDNRPLPEGPPSVWYKTQKFLKRNRIAVTVATLFAATALTGFVSTQRQARIAERRFDDVRQLATAFLFDFDKSIESVKGATQARQLVVAKGLEYLQKLERDAGADEALQEEIAGAYERLATIQGSVWGSHLGDYQKAVDSYQKAIGLRQKLAQAAPGNTARMLALGNSYLQLADGLFTKGETSIAIGNYKDGLRIIESLPTGSNRPTVISAALQRGYSRLCSFLLSTGDHKGAIDNCSKSSGIATDLVAAEPSNPNLRATLAATYGQAGNALRIDKRPKEAVSQLELASREFDKLVKEQPNNGNFARNHAGVLTVLAMTRMQLNDSVGAADAFEKSTLTLREMIKVDPADVRPRTTLGLNLIRLASVLIKTNRANEARLAGAEGLAMFRSFADRPQASPDDWNSYASYLMEIEVPELRDYKTALGYSKRAVSSVNEPSLVFLSTLTDAYAGTGDIKSAIATARKALSTPAPKERSQSGVRADLEEKLRRLEALQAK